MVRDKTEKEGRVGYFSALFESNQLTLSKSWIDLTHASSGFSRNWINSTNGSSGFPKKWFKSTLDSSEKHRFWIDAWFSSEMYGCLKSVCLYSYSTDIFKARSSWMAAYSIKIMFSIYDASSFPGNWIKSAHGSSVFPRSCFGLTSDSSSFWKYCLESTGWLKRRTIRFESTHE